jgi:hypothetical protein
VTAEGQEKTMGNRKSLFLGSFVMAVLSASILVGAGVMRAEEPLAAEKSSVESGEKTKPGTGQEPSEKPPAAKTIQNEIAEEAKSGVTTVQPEKPQPELDRRWIIKMKDEKDKKIPARKPVVMAWASEDQQTRCESYLPGLQESFSKTRYYSVGGDGCNTAGSAEAFLNLAKACEGDCPQGFLESKGYSKQILRNIDILHQLGEKKCMESTTEIGTAKVKTDKTEANLERKRPISGPHQKERRKVRSWSQDEGGETR